MDNMTSNISHKAYLELADIAETGNTSKLMEAYDKIATDYDQIADLTKANYSKMAAEAIANVNVDKNAEILDVCGGTGNVAKHLNAMGYKNLTYLDGSVGMMVEATKLNMYTTFVRSIIPEDKPTLIAADTFAVTVMSAGHVSKGKVKEMIRLAKPGGFAIIVTTEHAPQYQDEWDETEKEIKEAAKEMRATVVQIEQYKNSCIEEDGLPRPGHVIIIQK